MTTNSLEEIKLSTVTPIWTGGPDGKSDRLHITGIMGSLRWWYEAMIRGVGGHACDPSKHACLYDPGKPPYYGLCDVCCIFGATGWARRFKLMVSEDKLQPRKPAASSTDASGRRMFTLSEDHPVSKFPRPRWYLSGDPLYGSFTLQVTASASLDKEGKQRLDPKIIAALIQFIADWASIGAKPQMGLGVVKLAKRQSPQPLLKHLQQIVATHEKNKDRKRYNDYDELPSLHNMFFARVRIDRFTATESDTFDLKYDLRGDFRESFHDDHLRHTIMGYVKGPNRSGAKIMMSYPYDNGTIRIWGWIPKLTRSSVSRNEIMNEIYYFLEDTYGPDNLTFWLDFDPEKYDSMLGYLKQHLLKEAE